MLKILSDIMHEISDSGNALISKGIIYFGVGGSSVGVASRVAEVEVVASGSLTLADYGAIAGILGGISLVIKACTDIYFSYKKNKREETLLEIEVAKDDS